MTTTPTTQPLTAAHLPAGMVACPSCGVATSAPTDPAEAVTARPSESTPAGQRRDLAPVTLARCAACREVRDCAAALLNAHPRVASRVGTIAPDRTEAALCALAALGQPLPDPTTASEAEVSSLLHHLSPLGGAVRWAGLVTASGTASPYPWAHLTEGDRVALREGSAAVMRSRVARTEQPEVVAPPPIDPYGVPRGAVRVNGACLLCGVASVLVPAARVVRLGGLTATARTIWRPLTTGPGNLGGRAAPAPVAGHICPQCTEALASVGAVGPTALERALLDHLHATGRDNAADRLRGALSGMVGTVPGLVGWGALAVDALRRGEPVPEANGAPWAHLDLSEVTG